MPPRNLPHRVQLFLVALGQYPTLVQTRTRNLNRITHPADINHGCKATDANGVIERCTQARNFESRAIRKHFRILEGMFKTHEGASTDDEKKDWAVHYTDMDIEDQWRAFPTFDAGKTWKEFKDEVMRSYDGAAEDDEDAHKGFLKYATSTREKVSWTLPIT